MQVGWPLSVVLDAHALGQYQLLLRHLLELELVQRALHAAWRVYQQARPLFRRAATPLSGCMAGAEWVGEGVPHPPLRHAWRGCILVPLPCDGCAWVPLVPVQFLCKCLLARCGRAIALRPCSKQV